MPYIIGIYYVQCGEVSTVRALTKVFLSGRSQAVRIPKEFRFKCEEVYVEKHGDQLILTPRPKSWDQYFNSSAPFSDDFPDHIEPIAPEERESL